jgi:hypothetical protein
VWFLSRKQQDTREQLQRHLAQITKNEISMVEGIAKAKIEQMANKIKQQEQAIKALELEIEFLKAKLNYNQRQ